MCRRTPCCTTATSRACVGPTLPQTWTCKPPSSNCHDPTSRLCTATSPCASGVKPYHTTPPLRCHGVARHGPQAEPCDVPQLASCGLMWTCALPCHQPSPVLRRCCVSLFCTDMSPAAWTSSLLSGELEVRQVPPRTEAYPATWRNLVVR
jgi:hypothetical protein